MRLAALALCLAAVPQDKPAPAAEASPLRGLMECRPHRMKDEFDALGRREAKPGSVTSDACTFDEAIRRARAWVEANSKPGAVASLKADPLAKKAAGLIGLAGAAAAKGRLNGAVAALLEAAALEPENVTALANLAAALATVGLCAEAIAVADAALAKSKDKAGAMGIPIAAIAHNARGFALLRQGKHADAVKSLRQAVALAGPLASDAEFNLALALKKSGEEEEAKKFYIACCWRRPVEHPLCSGGRTPKPGDPPRSPFDRNVTTREPSALAFDLSFGTPGKFATLKHPQNVGQFKTFEKFHDREVKEYLESQQKFAEWVKSQKDNLPGNTPADVRAHLVVQYVEGIDDDPDIEPLFAAVRKGSEDLLAKGKKIAEGGKKRSEAVTKANLPSRERNARLLEIANSLINEMNGPVNSFDDLIRKYWEKSCKYQTGLAANIKSPFWRDRALWRIRVMRWTYWHRLVETLHDYYSLAYSAALSPDENAAEMEVPEKAGPEEGETPN